MWTSETLGLATWRTAESDWHVDVRGGTDGIGIIAPGDDDDPLQSKQRYLSFEPVDEDTLPVAAEQYIRGNELHVNYPQGVGSFALRLALRPIETTVGRWVLEARVSIQTDLLDTNPEIDVDVSCNDIDSFVPSDESGYNQVQGAGSAALTLAKNNGFSTSVLLGPHDSPFTTNHSSDTQLRLRLFGEFLEKGVIRKAFPWIVIDTTQTYPTETELQSYWMQLVSSPLPLTP